MGAAAVTSPRPTGSLNLPLPQPQQPPPSLPASATPSQQALQAACHCLQRVNADVLLGASRVESGTIKVLHAVVLQLVRPNMFKCRRLVRDAQLEC